MNLPNYFMADLGPEASVSAGMITEACQTLKRNRELYLRGRSTHSLIRTISELAANWLEPEYFFRKQALAADPEISGFPTATLRRGLDSFFGQLTADNLQALVNQDFGHNRRLDAFCASAIEEKLGRAALARGPEFLVHIAGGKIPNPTLLSMVFGLLLRSAQFIKCASGAAFLPRLFAHSLYEVEPKLGACLEIAEWPGGRTEVEGALFSEADCVTATGSDDTLTGIRQRLPVGVRWVGYGHRVSFGYITREALSGFNVSRLVASAARDVTAWNQLGCLSPHLFYIERGGRVSDEEFAQMLAEELDRQEESEPRGWVPDTDAATISNRRAFYEVRAAHAPETRQWTSARSTAWTVVYEAEPQFQISCLNRFVYVKPVGDLTHALQAADSVRKHVSTVGLAATDDRVEAIATALADWGVTRICPLGQMQNPPLAWRHDGRPALGDLITWTDWEQPD